MPHDDLDGLRVSVRLTPDLVAILPPGRTASERVRLGLRRGFEHARTRETVDELRPMLAEIGDRVEVIGRAACTAASASAVTSASPAALPAPAPTPSATPESAASTALQQAIATGLLALMRAQAASTAELHALRGEIHGLVRLFDHEDGVPAVLQAMQTRTARLDKRDEAALSAAVGRLERALEASSAPADD